MGMGYYEGYSTIPAGSVENRKSYRRSREHIVSYQLINYLSHSARSVDDTSVVAKLQHSEHRGQDGVRQEERKTLK